jgi:hypothetical protein
MFLAKFLTDEFNAASHGPKSANYICLIKILVEIFPTYFFNVLSNILIIYLFSGYCRSIVFKTPPLSSFMVDVKD